MNTYSPSDRFTVTPAGLAALASPRRAPCECERADDGALLYCAACLDAMDDGRDDGGPAVDLAGCYGGEEYRAPARYSAALAPADDADVIPFP